MQAKQEETVVQRVLGLAFVTTYHQAPSLLHISLTPCRGNKLKLYLNRVPPTTLTRMTQEASMVYLKRCFEMLQDAGSPPVVPWHDP